MYLISRNHKKLCKAFYRCMSSKSHYEVLNLPRTCTDKEIKDAFIRLSKKLHPDTSKDSNSHDQFVRVMEAYNVLGKPHLRKQYDIVRPVYTYSSDRASTAYNSAYTDAAGNYGRKTGQRTYYDDYRHNSNSGSSYYGFKGVKKRNHMTVVLVCLGFACLGLMLQLFMISTSFRMNQRRNTEVSMRNGQYLESARRAAAMNGTQIQTELLLKKISEGSSNPMATAALAETLAEKPNMQKHLDKQIAKFQENRATIYYDR